MAAGKIYLAVWILYILHVTDVFCMYGSGMSIYYLEDYCDRTLRIQNGGFEMQVSRGDYSSNMDCTVTIKASESHHKIYARYDEMEIACPDSLKFYDVEWNGREGNELSYRSCGFSNSQEMVTSGRELLAKFKSDNYAEKEGATVYITEFHTPDTGDCEKDEFHCSNGRCIHGELYCNEIDNCGDASDRCYKDYLWWVWMLVGFAVFFLICIVITVICCCVCKKKTKGQIIQANANPAQSVHYQTGSQTVNTGPATVTTGPPVNPWYGTPAAQTQSVYQPAYVSPQNPAYPPAYTPTSGIPAYPTTPNAPPPYSEKAQM